MIPKDLLLADGVVTALVTLQRDGGQTNGELAEAMELSESTVRDRMNRLHDNNLVQTDADLRDGNAVKVHELTYDGDRVAEQLRSIIADYESPGDPPDTEHEVTEVESGDPQDRSDDNRRSDSSEDGVKPSGFSFDDVDA